jgi:1,4-alpha-glucan branching enzyme
VWHGPSLLTDHDIYLFKEGTHFRLYTKLGSHPLNVEGREGTHFAVWAPNAERAAVIGDFNGWNPDSHPLKIRWDGSGIWEGFIPGVSKGVRYKYQILSKHNHYQVQKGDPFAFCWEEPPRTASLVWPLDYRWRDQGWMKDRGTNNPPEAPQSIYEVHLGSWRRNPDENNRWLSYRESAHRLVDYVKDMGCTHVEFLPLMEHPFYGSWGYQIT